MQDLITFDEYVNIYQDARPDNNFRDWAYEYIGYVDEAIEQDRQERDAKTASRDDWEWDR